MVHPHSKPVLDRALRLLCVEDDPHDLKLVTAILKRAGYDLAVEAVDEDSAFRGRLAESDYDVILCDFNLRNWTAVDALEILKESGKDIPLIVVSGSLGDEVASQCIKQGATDYVLKDRMGRLPSAIQGALEAKGARDKQRTAALALRLSAEQYRLLFDENPSPIWVFDLKDLRILAVNEAAAQFFGYSSIELLAMTACDLLPFENVPDFLTRLEANASKPTRMGAAGAIMLRGKSGEIIEAEIASRPIEILGRAARLVQANDVTERNNLQSQLHQAQRMESLGQLAGGVAHDLNNLLGVVMGYSELSLEQLEGTSPIRPNLKGIQSAAERAVVIVRQLLAFSRKQILQPRILNLNAVVSGMEALLRRLIREDIQLTIVSSDQLGFVQADPGQIEQIIMNLAVNASQAMPHGGRLTITLANTDFEEAGPPDSACPAGTFVMLEMSDTGCGIDAVTQTRIFEPFFTTKGPGHGTGLGLATVYGIVKQSGGSISVISELGHGATFRMCLPRVDSKPPAQTAAKHISQIPRGSETVLLTEDSEPLREVTRQFLQHAGYNVLAAEDGNAALIVSQKHVGPIHLLLTDVVMQGLSGPQLAQRLRIAQPGLPVLYMSGYADDALSPHGVLKEGVHLLEKPYTRASLLQKVREVLELTDLSTRRVNG